MDVEEAAPKELEIKLELAPSGLPRLAHIPFIRATKPKSKHTSEISVYFDTGKHKLRRHGLILRVRRIGNRYIQTIKATNGHLFARDEWESEIAGATPDLRCARGTALEPLITKKFRKKLKPVFETRVERTVYPLGRNANSIELAVDRGKIDAGPHSAPLCELELELKRGEEADLYEVARKLAHELPATLALKSKSERGYELADGRDAAPVKTVTIDLVRGQSARDGFRVIGRACLKQFVDNAPAVIKGDAEGVHQMRVGLRRLRAAIALFSDIVDAPQTRAIKRELKWLTNELSPAREMQVLIERVVAPLRGSGHHPHHAGIRSFSSDLVARREAAQERAQHAVDSVRFRALTLDVAAWLETGDWLDPHDNGTRALGDMPIEAFAGSELQRRYRKVKKRGRKLAELSARKRHKLRIRAKKLRYAAEFFTSLYDGKHTSRRHKAFVAALKDLQDGLGDLNDITIDASIMARAGVRPKRASRKRAFAAGLLTGHEDTQIEAALAAAVEGYKTFAAAKPFWH
ncbi:MAG TPA: CHAD domain-containing protein [Pseudolabrys sp.]|nr:CHAD domain-containing protein [Pseudolabrys sp.]